MNAKDRSCENNQETCITTLLTVCVKSFAGGSIGRCLIYAKLTRSEDIPPTLAGKSEEC